MIQMLQERSKMLQKARSFFYERGLIEVDCPIVSQLASVDAHIDLVTATVAGYEAFLHSSPEYGMKRLLSMNAPDMFQLSHVFRDGEIGSKHNPEFMMAEWYRRGMSFEAMMQETLDFCALFLGELPHEVISYEEAFLKYADINPFTASEKELQMKVPEHKADSRDDLLNVILALFVEPHLGKNSLVALAYYPPTQAALAKTRELNSKVVAERFEVYHAGVELANGYHELQDAKEQLQRLVKANEDRKEMGKNTLPIDMRFIEALQKGLPECCGVAVGFDRLMMLRNKAKALSDIMPFTWATA